MCIYTVTTHRDGLRRLSRIVYKSGWEHWKRIVSLPVQLCLAGSCHKKALCFCKRAVCFCKRAFFAKEHYVSVVSRRFVAQKRLMFLQTTCMQKRPIISSKSLTFLQASPVFPQKKLIFLQKSRMFPQKSPICPYLLSC